MGRQRRYGSRFDYSCKASLFKNISQLHWEIIRGFTLIVVVLKKIQVKLAFDKFDITMRSLKKGEENTPLRTRQTLTKEKRVGTYKFTCFFYTLLTKY